MQLFEKCMSSEKVPILFSVEDHPYCKLFSESAAHLPLVLQSLFDPAHLEHNYVSKIKVMDEVPQWADYSKLKQSQLHFELKVVPSGFVVYLDRACFGASPDSYVECSCYGPGVLEVKCPFCMRTEGFDAILKRPSFCLERNNDGNLALKTEHPYYYQCQLQMVATRRSYCDFVVWTVSREEPHIERILLDRVY